MNYYAPSSFVQRQVPLFMERLADQSLEPHFPSTTWQVGQLLTLCEPIATNPAGCVGLIYQVDMDDPDTPYVAIILETGDDLNLIEATHVQDHFIPISAEPFGYEFIDADTLMADFRDGLFNDLFTIAHVRLNHHD